MDDHPVTVAEFRRVREGDRARDAGRACRPDAADYPDADPALLVPGSLVFHGRHGPGRPRRLPQLVGVRARAPVAPPRGPGSNLDGRDRHPVTHVAVRGRAARTRRGPARQLPTEAEWEFAARGGLDGAVYAWGDEFAPDGRHDGQHVAGRVPLAEPRPTGSSGTSPVGIFPPNGYGLYDMTGNVWEWTSDYYTAGHPGVRSSTPAAGPSGPRVNSGGWPRRRASFNIGGPGGRFPRMVVKGGSHPCAPNYCHRCRPAARSAPDRPRPPSATSASAASSASPRPRRQPASPGHGPKAHHGHPAYHRRSTIAALASRDRAFARRQDSGRLGFGRTWLIGHRMRVLGVICSCRVSVAGQGQTDKVDRLASQPRRQSA